MDQVIELRKELNQVGKTTRQHNNTTTQQHNLYCMHSTTHLHNSTQHIYIRNTSTQQPSTKHLHIKKYLHNTTQNMQTQFNRMHLQNKIKNICNTSQTSVTYWHQTFTHTRLYLQDLTGHFLFVLKGSEGWQHQAVGEWLHHQGLGSGLPEGPWGQLLLAWHGHPTVRWPPLRLRLRNLLLFTFRTHYC